MQGQLPSGKDKGLRFAAVVQPEIIGGTIRQITMGNRPVLSIENGDELIIKISAATDYDYAKFGITGKDPLPTALAYLKTNLNYNS
ncbi:hypothetical protein MD537_22430, partial [Flavihumibacter sediminis]|nr:hypothetical protein [Flavihumibacter sediminis]